MPCPIPRDPHSEAMSDPSTTLCHLSSARCAGLGYSVPAFLTFPFVHAYRMTIDLDRFGGIGRLYGSSGLARLASSHVAVIGIGGVGSWSVEALARSGVGRLTLVDLDDICVTNTNRQIHTLSSTIGATKTGEMAQRARAISPMVEVEEVEDFFTESTAAQILDRGYDFVVDAIDDTRNKCRLIAACRERGIPLVVCGGAGGRRDPTQLHVADLNRSSRDGLVRDVRRTLRRDFGFPKEDVEWGIPCVFSKESAVFPTSDGEVCDTRPAGQNMRLDCASGFGTASFVTGTMGLLAASVVVNQLGVTPPATR